MLLPPAIGRRRPRPAALLLQARSLLDARVKWARDRALDHVVERERHLVPFLLTKDLLLSSPPPHALPLSAVSSAPSIPFPFRALRFLRLFPSSFSIALPRPPAPPLPTISPTPHLAALHSTETHLLATTRPDAADRLLRLLMLSPSRTFPLALLSRLRLDLGLAPDFPRSLLPLYPDYFSVSGSGHLELVCYRKDLAVSAMQSYAQRTGGYRVGDSLPFPLSFPRGFDLDKKVRKWLDEWQRLPYLSPYEDGSHLAPRSDITEKRTVAALHEVLSLTVAKKMEKESLVKVGEVLRLPPGFRKVIARHPGIFYVAHKLRTQTVVLREAYRRHMLLEKHPLMGLRYQYLHLMHMGREEAAKAKAEDRGKGKGKSKGRKGHRAAEMLGEEHGVGEEEDEEEEELDEDYNDVDDDEEEEEGMNAGVGSEDEESDDDDDEIVGNSMDGETRRRRQKTVPTSRIAS